MASNSGVANNMTIDEFIKNRGKKIVDKDLITEETFFEPIWTAIANRT